jgi:hypothetical protein
MGKSGRLPVRLDRHPGRKVKAGQHAPAAVLTGHLAQQVTRPAAHVEHPLVAAPGQPLQGPATEIYRIQRVELVGSPADVQAGVVGIGLLPQDHRVLSGVKAALWPAL